MVEYKNKDYESNRILAIAEHWSKSKYKATQTARFQNVILQVFLQVGKTESGRNKEKFDWERW